MKLLRLKDVCDRLALSRSVVLALVEAGQLPGPIIMGPRTHRWRDSDIDSYISSLK